MANCRNPECDKGYIWRQVGIGENYEASRCPDCGPGGTGVSDE